MQHRTSARSAWWSAARRVVAHYRTGLALRLAFVVSAWLTWTYETTFWDQVTDWTGEEVAGFGRAPALVLVFAALVVLATLLEGPRHRFAVLVLDAAALLVVLGPFTMFLLIEVLPDPMRRGWRLTPAFFVAHAIAATIATRAVWAAGWAREARDAPPGTNIR